MRRSIDNLSSATSYIKMDDGWGRCLNHLGDCAMTGSCPTLVLSTNTAKGANGAMLLVAGCLLIFVRTGVVSKFGTKPVKLA